MVLKGPSLWERGYLFSVRDSDLNTDSDLPTEQGIKHFRGGEIIAFGLLINNFCTFWIIYSKQSPCQLLILCSGMPCSINHLLSSLWIRPSWLPLWSSWSLWKLWPPLLQAVECCPLVSMISGAHLLHCYQVAKLYDHSPAVNPGLQKGATIDFLSDAGASLTSVLLPALVEDVSVLWAFPWDMIIWWVSQTHVMYLTQHVHFSEHFIPSAVCHSNSDISASLSVGHHFVSRLPGAGLELSLLYPLGSSNVKVCIPRKCLQKSKNFPFFCYGPDSSIEHPHNPVP